MSTCSGRSDGGDPFRSERDSQSMLTVRSPYAGNVRCAAGIRPGGSLISSAFPIWAQWQSGASLPCQDWPGTQKGVRPPAYTRDRNRSQVVPVYDLYARRYKQLEAGQAKKK